MCDIEEGWVCVCEKERERERERQRDREREREGKRKRERNGLNNLKPSFFQLPKNQVRGFFPSISQVSTAEKLDADFSEPFDRHRNQLDESTETRTETGKDRPRTQIDHL